MLAKLAITAVMMFQSFASTTKVLPLGAVETKHLLAAKTQADLNVLVKAIQAKYVIDGFGKYKPGWENGFAFSDDCKYIVSNQTTFNLDDFPNNPTYVDPTTLPGYVAPPVAPAAVKQ